MSRIEAICPSIYPHGRKNRPRSTMHYVGTTDSQAGRDNLAGFDGALLKTQHYARRQGLADGRQVPLFSVAGPRETQQ